MVLSLPTEGSGAAGSKFKVQGSNALKHVQGSELHTDLTELTDFVSPVVKVLQDFKSVSSVLSV